MSSCGGSRCSPKGGAAAQWSAPATLQLSGQPEKAAIDIERVLPDELGHRRLVQARLLLNRPGSVELEPGSYVVTLRAKGFAPVIAPVSLHRGEHLSLPIDLPASAAVPDGYAYVPPGRFLFGSSDEGLRKGFLRTVPQHAVQTAGYLIARHETTYGDWIRFLEALPPAERAARLPRLERMSGGLKLEQTPAGTWKLTLQPASRAYTAAAGEMIVYPGRKKAAAQDWLNIPVSGISWADAKDYAAWLDKTGQVPHARLCEETEWERGARGADEREFPEGDSVSPDDADFDETYGQEPLSFGPDAVGSHPASRSPFGLDDMLGNVWSGTHRRW